MIFEVFMQVWCLQKSKLWWKQGKTGEKNQDSEIFARHNPCAKMLLCQFPKSMLSVPSQNPLCEFHRNANLVRTLCEIIFGKNFQNHALCLGTPQECEIFAQHKVSCEICTSSLHSIATAFTIHHRPFLQFSAPSTIKNLPILHSTL